MEREIISRAEAKVRGLGRYFTGVPCKHGHTTERYINTRQCAECNRIRARKSKAAAYKNADTRKILLTRAKKWRDCNPEKADATRRRSAMKRRANGLAAAYQKKMWAYALAAKQLEKSGVAL